MVCRVRLEENVAPRQWIRFKSSFEGIELLYSYENQEVHVGPDERLPNGLMLVQELEETHQDLCNVLQLQGHPLKAYKPMERCLLLTAAIRSLGSAPEFAPDPIRLLHEVTWAQPLPNGNHRTAYHVTRRLLEGETKKFVEETALEDIVHRFFIKSKKLIGEKEFEPQPHRLKSKHLQLTQEFATSFQKSGG